MRNVFGTRAIASFRSDYPAAFTLSIITSDFLGGVSCLEYPAFWKVSLIEVLIRFSRLSVGIVGIGQIVLWRGVTKDN